MANAVWFNCFAGIAGDMALASLIDAGADAEYVRAGLATLNLSDDWNIDTEETQRCGVKALYLRVDVDDSTTARSYADIRDLIEAANLSKRVKARAQKVFLRLAEVEADIHSTTVEDVHFHEVGGLDSIIDIVGVCLALESLKIEHVFASAVATGTGTIRAAHGILPNPAPAVVALLHGAPVKGLDQPYEMTTPTGAAILAALCERFGALPDFEITSSGFGAGLRDIEGLPNTTQAIVGNLTDVEAAFIDAGGQAVMVLEVNVDDATGEVLALTTEKLLAAGAHDAWITPIIMKKGRPAHTVSVLADVAKADEMSEILIHETGSLGIRGQEWQRWPRRRQFDSVTFDQQLIGIKVTAHRNKVEFDDAAKAAEETGRPTREVLNHAEIDFARRQALPPPKE